MALKTYVCPTLTVKEWQQEDIITQSLNVKEAVFDLDWAGFIPGGEEIQP